MNTIKILFTVFLTQLSFSVFAQVFCPENTNCDEPLELCADTTQTVDCDTCGSYHTTTLYYDLQIVNANQEVTFTVESNTISGMFPSTFRYKIWSLNGDPCPGGTFSVLLAQQTGVNSGSFVFPFIGNYMLVLDQLTDCPHVTIDFVGENTCTPPSIDTCESCIGSFAPIPGSNYVITAWTKEEGTAATITSYSAPELYIHFTVPDPTDTTATITVTEGPFTPMGAIIDGWQRIESEFSIPPDAIDIEIELASNDGNVLFDDVRMFPFKASMKTFVYDPINMRLSAELDERHFATFYEYDEEGKLVRIKKETEKGIMTIQETKSNATK